MRKRKLSCCLDIYSKNKIKKGEPRVECMLTHQSAHNPVSFYTFYTIFESSTKLKNIASLFWKIPLNVGRFPPQIFKVTRRFHLTPFYIVPKDSGVIEISRASATESAFIWTIAMAETKISEKCKAARYNMKMFQSIGG